MVDEELQRIRERIKVAPRETELERQTREYHEKIEEISQLRTEARQLPPTGEREDILYALKRKEDEVNSAYPMVLEQIRKSKIDQEAVDAYLSKVYAEREQKERSEETPDDNHHDWHFGS